MKSIKGKIINFDNSATTFPKPPSVKRAVWEAVEKYGGNPGRSGHKLSLQVADEIYKVRENAARMFGAKVENVAFTANCTFALNMAIKGIMQYGGHIIISGYEHNAVGRPVYALSKMRGVEYSVARISDNAEETVGEIERLIRKNTKAVCMTVASNVTGRILPYKEIGKLCRDKGICFIGDGAQGCGVLNLTMNDGFNFLCTAGHKALYGPTGTGLLVSDGRYSLSTIIEGGTGATSAQLLQTPFLPEQLESGTINTVGIIGLGEGLKFVEHKGIERIRAYEDKLCRQLVEEIADNKRIKLYETEVNKVAVQGFNVGDMDSQEVAQILSDKGFALRGGLQCAALTHQTLETTKQGIVRFSPSAFNTPEEVRMLSRAINSIK